MKKLFAALVAMLFALTLSLPGLAGKVLPRLGVGLTVLFCHAEVPLSGKA